jgi:hypothetical protein
LFISLQDEKRGRPEVASGRTWDLAPLRQRVNRTHLQFQQSGRGIARCFGDKIAADGNLHVSNALIGESNESCSVLIKPVVASGFGLMHSPSQARRPLTAAPPDAVVKTDLESSTRSGPLKSGRTGPASIIPTCNAPRISQG